jgi:hypothetical protein
VYERSKTLLNLSPCSTLHQTFSTSKRLTVTKLTFTRRTSGHCLGTFVAANLNLCSPLPLKVVPIATPPLPLLSLSLFFGFKGLIVFGSRQFRWAITEVLSLSTYSFKILRSVTSKKIPGLSYSSCHQTACFKATEGQLPPNLTARL